MSDETRDHGQLMALLVHDLRNPTATLTANVEYLRETSVGREDEDAREALEDVHLALQALKKGLDRMAWMARWLSGDDAASVTDGDLGAAVLAVCPDALVEAGLRPVRGGASFGHVLQVFVDNAQRYARDQPADVSVFERDGRAVVRFEDAGTAMAPEFRETAFTVAGQSSLKGRADGRYAQFAGLVAARALMDAIGGTIEPSSHEGGARFEFTLDFV